MEWQMVKYSFCICGLPDKLQEEKHETCSYWSKLEIKSYPWDINISYWQGTFIKSHARTVIVKIMQWYGTGIDSDHAMV